MAKTSGVTGEYYSPESDLHHLTQAHAIRKNPKRHKAAKALAKQKMAGMSAMMNDPEDNPALGGDAGRDEAKEKA